MITRCMRCGVGTCLAAGAALTLVVGTAEGGVLSGSPVAAGLVAQLAALDTCPEDTDGDAIVGVTDLLNVIGNWGVGPFDPPGSDTNGDGVVNIVDFLAVLGSWGPCLLPEPHLAGYSNSGCLMEGGSDDMPCEEDDAFEFIVEGNGLCVSHLNATYNCCPDDIEVSLVVEEWLLILTEEEVLVEPCFCLCCYEVASTVEGLSPGEYAVEYWWYDYETGQEQCHVEIVVIPDDPM
jgi:hypothetical protein